LHHRDATGKGQVVDSAIYESVLAMMESLITEYDKAGFVRERTGAILPHIAPSNVYPTRDGEMVLIAANQDTVFARLVAAMDRPELARDARYATHMARGAHQAELDALLSAWSATVPAQELLERLARHGVPSGRIYRAPEMLDDEHFKAREAIVSVPHPDFGELRMQNVVPKLSATPGGIRSPSPQLGEHNDATYLGLLGLKAERYAELKKMKVI
jgi:formyl-CoA transferase